MGFLNRQISGQRGTGGLGDDDEGPRFQAWWQHQTHRLAQRRQGFIGKPACHGDLKWRGDGEGVKDFGYDPDQLRRKVGWGIIVQGDDDPQRAARLQWNLYQVAHGGGSSATENISYTGEAGTYLWRVYSYSGSGSYELAAVHP